MAKTKGRSIKNFASVIREAARLFILNDPLRMAGATAFFTMFALPPILIILVQVFSLFIDPKTIRSELFRGLSETFGKEAVRLIITVIKGITSLNYNWVATILGFLFLSFVATTLFKVIKSSLNQLWGLPARVSRKPLVTLQSRLKSLLIVLFTGLVFTVAVFIEALQVIIGRYIFKLVPSVSPLFNSFQAFVISTFILAAWFLIIYRYLSHGRPAWRIAWVGALFTSVLFSFGKMVLHFLLSYNNINSIYGASASVVLLLLFLFYSAMMLYFGAAFTKSWAQSKGCDIEDWRTVKAYGKKPHIKQRVAGDAR